MKKAKWARLELAKFTLILLRGDGIEDLWTRKIRACWAALMDIAGLIFSQIV
jgi:hypothetical protein